MAEIQAPEQQVVEEVQAVQQEQQQQQQQQPMEVDVPEQQPAQESKSDDVAAAAQAQVDEEQRRLEQEAARLAEERRLAKEQQALEKEKRLAKERQQRADLAAITKTIAEIDGFPEAARSMLLEGLPHAFSTNDGGKVPAHKMQSSFVDLVASALEDANSRATKFGSEAGEAAQAAENELKTCEKDLADTEEAAKVAKEEAEAKSSATFASSKIAREAATEHQQAERASQNSSKIWQQIREERERAAAVAEGSLQMLATGGWDDDDVKSAAMKAVEEHLQHIKVDKTLAIAAPLALEVRPAKRARFDTITVDTISDAVKKGLSALDEKLEAIAPEEAEAEAELLGLWAIADVARDKVADAERAQSDAQAGFITANASFVRTAEKLSEQKETISSFASQQAVFDAKAEDCKQALAAVQRLRAGIAAQ